MRGQHVKPRFHRNRMHTVNELLLTLIGGFGFEGGWEASLMRRLPLFGIGQSVLEIAE